MSESKFTDRFGHIWDRRWHEGTRQFRCLDKGTAFLIWTRLPDRPGNVFSIDDVENAAFLQWYEDNRPEGTPA